MLAFSHFLLASSLVSSAFAVVHNVKVGENGLKFEPNQIKAAAGDEIIFEFHPKNHTLTQSTLGAPCTPLAGGGNSGFMAVAPGSTTFPTKRLIVPDATTPLWFYCAQGTHCQSGMVFAVNPKDDAQMATFLANAAGGTTTPPADPPTSPPPAAGGTVHEVAVGRGGLKFDPESLTGVNVGDSVKFTFFAGAHTVTQSTFVAPCAPLAGGVDSGSKPVTAGQTTDLPTFVFNVTDTSKPIWMYCKTGTHCSTGGMVFSLNPTATQTAEQYKANAVGGAPVGGTQTVSNTIPAPSPSAPANGNGKVHTVSVGQGGLTFSPEKLEGAVVGDQILFTFYGGSHTATQSSFIDPCNPLASGADSGPQPVQAGQTTGLPTFTFNVTSVAKPLWFYCKTGNHCKSGMVLSVNPTAAQTHEAFKATAMGQTNSTDTPPDAASSRMAGGAAGVVFAAALAGLLL